MTDDVTTRLAEVEQRANAASQGPWQVDGPHYWDEDDLANVVTDPNREPVALQPSTSMRRPWGRRQDSGWPGHNDDIAFIAHARADVPWLVERIRLALAVLRDATPSEERREAQGTHSPNCHQYHVGCLVSMLRRIFEGKVEPVVKPCKDCGCPLADHHKLRCENERCSGCNGWTCPEHGWVLCGCTYAGGVDPETGRYPTPDTQPSKDTRP